MTNINKVCLGLVGCSVFLLIACASEVKKADIANTANPQEEYSRLDSDIHAAVDKNIDVLAPTEFKASVKWRDAAQADLASAKKQEQVLDDIRSGRGYLEKAYITSADRETKASGLFAARQAALRAGAGTQPEMQKDLSELDSEVSADADRLATVPSEKLAALQDRYIGLERRAVIITQLGNAQAMFNGAIKDGATKSLPLTAKKTDLSIKTAESIISANVRNPDGYQAAVAQANTDSTLLSDVMNTVKQNKGLSETAALRMVAQNRQINNLKTEGVASESANQKLSSDLAVSDRALDSAKSSVEVQRVIDSARREFSPDEAEAYQQGGDLLIRLKNINFASGRSDLPEASLSSLAKVAKVAKELNASEIKIEGHTDSVGTETQNKTLSEGRANAVATYFKSNGFNNIDVQSAGYGFTKPIATNKSKAGRAQNRRVDIVITPMAVQ